VNAIIMLAFLITSVFVAVLFFLALITASIRHEERDMNLPEQPGTCAEAFTHRILGVYVRRPGQFHVLAAHVTSIPREPPGHETSSRSSAQRP
jgi:hypothetical protein